MLSKQPAQQVDLGCCNGFGHPCSKLAHDHNMHEPATMAPASCLSDFHTTCHSRKYAVPNSCTLAITVCRWYNTNRNWTSFCTCSGSVLKLSGVWHICSTAAASHGVLCCSVMIACYSVLAWIPGLRRPAEIFRSSIMMMEELLEELVPRSCCAARACC